MASIAATAAIAAAALLYLRGLRRLRSQYPEIAAGCRPSLLLAGLAVLWVVIASPLSALDHRLLTFHMLQHLVLMTIAAPLLLLSGPGAAFLRGLPVPARRAAIWALRSDPVRRIGRALTHPALCWLVGTGIVIAWHVPPAHELGLRSSFWHVVQHATFFGAGLLFWWPIVYGTARTALGAAPLYLFLATLPCDALSAFLSFCGRVIYPSHAGAPVFLGMNALQDQECAGALMWFWVTIAYLLPAAAITLRMLWPRAAEAVSAPGKNLAGPLNAGTGPAAVFQRVPAREAGMVHAHARDWPSIVGGAGVAGVDPNISRKY
ncbi:MAG TPA: cytochrome c oxidase assembly protein [Myxococcales bacterium]|nr:cytochrome c oxidase assembly protein [Myxococcales bacterium]